MASSAVLLIAVVLTYFGYSCAQCDLDISKDLPTKDPVFITKTGQLWVPTNGSLRFDRNEENIISCGKKKDTPIKCSSKKDFTAGGKKINIADLECGTSVTGDFEATSLSCGNGGKIHKIGFSTTHFGLVKLYDVCFDLERVNALYSHHIIYGQAINNTAKAERPTFKSAGYPPKAKPLEAFKQSTQLGRFTDLLQSEAEARRYITKTSFLARGHLNPDGDGIFKSWQYATYFYLNVAPQWQVVNAGNWLRVENIARKVASQLADAVQVYTGTYDILELPNKSGRMVNMSLESDYIPIPKWFWKILKYKNKGIAFITLNNPFVEKTNTLCPNICKKAGHSIANFDDYRHGYTYCCEVSELMKAIKHIPKEAKVKTLLKI